MAGNERKGRQMTDTEKAAAELRGLDVRTDTAIADQDGATLQEIFADDFLYTHSNGDTQTGSDYIRVHVVAKRPDTPPRRNLSAQRAEVHGDVGVTRADMDVVFSDERGTRYMRIVRVYRLQNGRWRTISSRTLPAVDRAPAKG